ncbi:MAG: hypothetical protein ACKOC5_17710, partial [Chloroflexota bacterium]
MESLSKKLPVVEPETQKTGARGYTPWLTPIWLAGALLAWQLAVELFGLPAFILPPPGLVWGKLLAALVDGTLLRHGLVTLGEVLAGLA